MTATVRSVVVRLVADVTGMSQGMSRVRGEADKLATGLGAIGLAAGAAFGAAVYEFAQFDAKMSQLQALTHAGAGGMQDLAAAAKTAGIAFGFSATQVADAEIELTKAGIGVNDIMGGALRGSLALAAAGQIDVAHATEIAASAMTQFKLAGSDVPHIADLLAAGADKALGGVGELGDGLAQVGTTAAQMGWSLDETVGTLAEFAQNAQIGQRGGTLLNSMLLQLTAPTKEAKQEMDKLGFSMYDANGNMVDSSVLAGRLQKSFGGLNPEARNAAAGMIFGSRAIRGFNILMADGAETNAKWVSTVNDAGFAALQASSKMDNLKGDFTKLKATIQNDLIDTGSNANATLRALTQGLTRTVESVGEMPQPLQQAALGMLALTAATGLMGAGLLKTIPRLVETRAALTAVRDSSTLAAASMRGLSVAAVAVALGTASVAAEQFIGDAQVVKVRTDDLQASLLQLGQSGQIGATGLDALSTRFGPLHNNVSTTSEALRRFGTDAYNALDKGWDARLGRLQNGGQTVARFKGQVAQLDSAFAAMVQSGHMDEATNAYNQFIAAAKAQGAPVEATKAAFVRYNEAVKDASNATAVAGSTTLSASQAFQIMASDAGSAAEQADEVAASMQALDKALSALYDQFFGAKAAEDAFHESLNGLKKDTDKHSKTLDGNSKAALANRDALRARVKSALEALQADVDSGASLSQVTAKTKTYKKELVDSAVKAGLSKTAAKKYADALDQVPATVKTSFTTPGLAGALSQTQAYSAAQAALQRHVNITYALHTTGKAPGSPDISQTTSNPYSAAGHYVGGYIAGAGTATSDSIPARLSNGEFVMNAAATSRNRGLLEAMNAKKYAAGGYVGVRGYASGGFVPADFSAITSLIPTSVPTKADLAAALERQVKATRSLANAEDALDKVRHRKGHSAADVARAERAVANARDNVTTATTKLNTVEGQRKAAAQPYSARFHAAATSSNAATTRFLRDLATLRAWGFGGLADQLLAAGDDGAMKLAASAVKSHSAARTVSRDVATSSALARRVAAGQDALSARQAAASYFSGASADAGAYSQFLKDVQTLAGKGYGALAQDLLAKGVDEGGPLARAAVTASAKTLAKANAGITSQTASSAAADGMPARLAIQSALGSHQNLTLAQLATATGLSTSDLQTAALAMRAQLGGSSYGSNLLAGLNATSQYNASPAGSTGTGITVQVLSTGNPWADGEKAAAGAKRVLAVSQGKW